MKKGAHPMTIMVTSRHFKAHQSLVDYAESAVQRLTRYYDGIIKGDVVLSYEKSRRSTKIAEIVVSVYRMRLTAQEEGDNFFKSIDGAVAKVLVQLKKYKGKLHAKDRNEVRRVREKI